MDCPLAGLSRQAGVRGGLEADEKSDGWLCEVSHFIEVQTRRRKEKKGCDGSKKCSIHLLILLSYSDDPPLQQICHWLNH